MCVRASETVTMYVASNEHIKHSCNFSHLFFLSNLSRWVSRSATAQRRKDRLRQHSEHIGLDNDLREVSTVIMSRYPREVHSKESRKL